MTNDYIRKEDAIEVINQGKLTKLIDADVAESGLKNLPAADVAPVVHGRWVKPKGMMPPEYHGHYECSECGTWAGRDWVRPLKEILLTNFCPNCGAKMDEGKKKNE